MILLFPLNAPSLIDVTLKDTFPTVTFSGILIDLAFLSAAPSTVRFLPDNSIFAFPSTKYTFPPAALNPLSFVPDTLFSFKVTVPFKT